MIACCLLLKFLQDNILIFDMRDFIWSKAFSSFFKEHTIYINLYLNIYKYISRIFNNNNNKSISEKKTHIQLKKQKPCFPEALWIFQ